MVVGETAMAQMTLFGKTDDRSVEVKTNGYGGETTIISGCQSTTHDESLEQRRKEFEHEMRQERERKIIPIVKLEIKPEIEERAIELFLEDIRISGSLWDMRCWDIDHDIDEVRAWVQNPERLVSNNYVTILIDDLLKRGVVVEIIVKAVMDNDRVTWKKRVCKCFHDSNACPRYRDAESPKYFMANCHSCRDVC